MPSVWQQQHQGKGYNTDQTFFEILITDIDSKEEQNEVFDIIEKALKITKSNLGEATK